MISDDDRNDIQWLNVSHPEFSLMHLQGGGIMHTKGKSERNISANEEVAEIARNAEVEGIKYH